MRLRLIKKNNQGQILLLTLLILTSMMVASLAAVDFIVPGIKMSRTQAYSTIAYFAAEAGCERSLWEVYKNNFDTSRSDQNGIYQTTLNNGSTYVVNYDRSGNTRTFTAIGSYQGVSRSVEVSFLTQ